MACHHLTNVSPALAPLTLRMRAVSHARFSGAFGTGVCAHSLCKSLSGELAGQGHARAPCDSYTDAQVSTGQSGCPLPAPSGARHRRMPHGAGVVRNAWTRTAPRAFSAGAKRAPQRRASASKPGLSECCDRRTQARVQGRTHVASASWSAHRGYKLPWASEAWNHP